jgi:nitroreductase
MIEKKAITQVPVNRCIADRWSGCAYNPDRLLTQEEIIALLEAAHWAPSCYGDQPWRFIVCDKGTNKEAWDKACACLSGGNQSWAKNAPLLLLAVADSVLSRNGNPNRWGQYDTGAASENLSIQATDMGLMVHQMGGFDADQSREVFAIPKQYTPMAMLAVGYQLELELIPEEMKGRELAERHRNPLGDHFFDGEWGVPVNTES